MRVQTLKARKVSRQEADAWLRRYFAPNCAIIQDAALSFCDEWTRHESGQQVLALPESDRTYFMVSKGKVPLLLAGVNSHCSLSSFMKLNWLSEYRGFGKECVRTLIETEVVKLCRERGNQAFSVHVATELGRELFEDFIAEPPKGVRRIEPTTAGYTTHISMFSSSNISQRKC